MQINIKYFLLVMVVRKTVSAKIHFGTLVAAFRQHYRLSQRQLATLLGSDRTYVGKVEKGSVNVGIEFIEKLAAAIDAEYYEIVNPNFKFPDLDTLPKDLRDNILTARQRPNSLGQESRVKITTYLDPVIDSNFLQIPQTGRMIADEIKRLYDVTIPPGRITAELTKAPRNEKVKIVDRPAGRTEPGNWYQSVAVN